MKNKLFILIIIVLAFITGICLNSLFSQNDSNINQNQKKERLFTQIPDVPVSNSNAATGKIIFKSFFAYNNDIDLTEFSVQDEGYYFKKIISYDDYQKYKELIPELRTLTEDDFINYYLIIALSKNIDSVYMFNKLEELDNSILLKILKNKQLSPQSTSPIYSGIAIVLPNITEVPEQNIKFEIEQNY